MKLSSVFNRTKTITLLIIFSVLASCTKEEIIPDSTILPSGENTMYYYIDGGLYIPKSTLDLPFPNIPAISFYQCSNSESFRLETKNLELFFYEGIQQSEIAPINQYQSNQNTCEQTSNFAIFYNKVKVGIFENGDPAYDYVTLPTDNNAGMLNITWSSANHRQFKGTFEFTVYDEDGPKNIHITDGHFDINLDTLNQ